jgi:hypothetical protein
MIQKYYHQKQKFSFVYESEYLWLPIPFQKESRVDESI